MVWADQGSNLQSTALGAEQIQSKTNDLTKFILKKILDERPGGIAVLSSNVGVIDILLSRCGKF